MTLPRIPRSLHEERAGILAVATALHGLGFIWRETPNSDVGIDGQIEFVDDFGQATGQIVAAQVKSGESYFRSGNEDSWHFHPGDKHRVYWERFPLPVVLFLHSPSQGTYWVDVRRTIRSPERSRLAYIEVPKRNVLSPASRTRFLSSLGTSGRPFLPVRDVLTGMAAMKSRSASLPLTYLDLFASGLTNIGRAAYYGMDLVVEVAETLLIEAEEDVPFGIGAPEHEFLFAYVEFLVEQQIADVDMSDCFIDWIGRGIHPQFIAPLTSRGRSLARLINDCGQRFTQEEGVTMPRFMSLAQETRVRMIFTGTDYVRIPLIQQFGRWLVESTPPNSSE